MVIKFKPLEWKVARKIGGVEDYWVGCAGGSIQATVAFFNGEYTTNGKGYPTLEEAKAVGFELHKQRVLKLLDLPEGDPNL